MAEDRLDDLLRRLAQSGARVLPLHGSQVEVLESPDQFYQLLLHSLATAQRHISIASLYFGTGGGREQEFVDALAAAAHDTAARPQLQIRLLLDALRSTRPTKGAAVPGGAEGSSGSGTSSGTSSSDGSAAAQLTSTAEMLAVHLLEGQQQQQQQEADGSGQQEPRVAVSLFHTPALRGLLKRVLPPRVSEIIGVQHMKCFVFDDTVVLSGANISSTYLSTRQDRYIVIRSAPQLASLLRQLPDAQLPWSGLRTAPWLVRSSGSGGGSSGSDPSSSSRGWVAAMPSWGGSAAAWSGGSSNSGASALVQLASPYLNLARPLERFLSRRAGSLELELVTAAPEANGFFGSKGVSGMIPLAYSLLEQRTWRRLTRQQRRLAWRQAWEQPRDRDSSGSAWGPLAAGAGPAPVEAASPEAVSSWPPGAGTAEAPAGWPPGAGTTGALLPGSGRRLFEFCRPGWEYHAKGIWVSLPAAEAGSSGGSGSTSSSGAAPMPPPAGSTSSGDSGRWAAPAVTSVGSSNYGWRSLRRDLELNFLVVTRNPQLQQALGREVELLKSHCQEVLGDAHFRAPGRRATAAARLAVRLLRGFL
ncbi:CDP-diacylglycerol--glycerol-3-phosphate 3- mitochondrial [Chlorella sorokiniana]|uniref:CDP-diacylglycerol--glycerol-3-phosphate 3-phosphatidyltransferase n=1 Tax=Chlorella sorokiniana TaxID=3076 RepID=A0A2P6U1T7_CHLSO|nr:CDP-diacylglycerol--glycerol-3-phosphate 3- mitochondrial [Chlorella sorokiniana]|eukprot:PRW60278.1 CDP-diacylglycerol--glycerol-3-phosphate 3- mitochondrial [Chlorella sorokiniana]